MNKFETALETVGKDVVKVVESPALLVGFVVKAERVIATAIKDQPQLKAEFTELVKRGESISTLVLQDVAERGLNLGDDLATLAQVEDFFRWFVATVVPTIEAVYGEIKTDVQE